MEDQDYIFLNRPSITHKFYPDAKNYLDTLYGSVKNSNTRQQMCILTILLSKITIKQYKESPQTEKSYLIQHGILNTHVSHMIPFKIYIQILCQRKCVEESVKCDIKHILSSCIIIRVKDNLYFIMHISAKESVNLFIK